MSNLNNAETLTARVSPWMDDKAILGGNVVISEDSHPRSPEVSSSIKEALIALADEILTAYGRDPMSDAAAGIEVTIRLSPSPWK